MRKILARNKPSIISVTIFSFFSNLLMLTGPLFMLQIYDRVLGSRSQETLVSLLILVVGLYALMGVLDYARGRVAARIGAIFQNALDQQVFTKTISTNEKGHKTALQDLEAIQRLFASPALLAMIDIPWAPIFILGIFVFHPLLGWLALIGGLLLVAIAIANQILSKKPVNDAQMKGHNANLSANAFQNGHETIRGLGMQQAIVERWYSMRQTALASQINASDMTGTFTTLSKTFRMFLQSAILALGAYLVLRGELTAGAMIAGSIMMGRALTPVEQTIGQWQIIQRARLGWNNLDKFLSGQELNNVRTTLPRPRAILRAEKVAAAPPNSNTTTLRMVSFEVTQGQALGIIGPSASGKSSLARVVTGIWPYLSGSVRLDGAKIDQYGEELGSHIGYLPQEVTLFPATIAENIARMSSNPNPEAVVAAAKKAGAHEMILKLADGYDTMISAESISLSGGQKQRIGLARAMYGDPVLLVLDEPNANLDSVGSDALNAAIRDFKAAGNAVIIMAHRPSGITECEMLLILQDGVATAFGPRDEVLQANVKNHAQVAKTIRTEE